MSSIVEVPDNRVDDVNTFSMILCEHHLSDFLKKTKSYHHGIEKVKNKKYDSNCKQKQ